MTDIVFLHGKGADATAHSEFMLKLAAKYDASLHSVEAPLPYKNGYSWFNKIKVGGRNIADEESFARSVDFIKTTITDCGFDCKHLIICGHSQGGAMAVAVGLQFPVLKIISICGDWPENIDCQPICLAREFVWIEGGKDAYLSDERKSSYQRLQKMGINLKYIKDNDTEHDAFSPDLIEKL